MLTHSSIDNRREKLEDHISRILETSDAARFAVGYFFLSGLTAIAGKLSCLKELWLLIGNTTNRETLEQIAAGYHRIEMVADAAEAERFPKWAESKQMASELTAGVRTGIARMDQTDSDEGLVRASFAPSSR